MTTPIYENVVSYSCSFEYNEAPKVLR